MKAYSLDLRDRVIATYKEGRLNKTEISILFKVSYDTVLDWIKRYIATGDYSSKQGSGCGRAMRFNDKNAILKFIEENIRKILNIQKTCTKFQNHVACTIKMQNVIFKFCTWLLNTR